ncbi:MAG: hypothetical protein LH613_12720 [Chamaesiphon sp.]|nr:hypothetical protein [Chamaesiphon sp.]
MLIITLRLILRREGSANDRVVSNVGTILFMEICSADPIAFEYLWE